MAHVSEGDKEDIDRTANAARKAFDEGPWRTMTPAQRGQCIKLSFSTPGVDNLSTLSTCYIAGYIAI